ncbi:binding-protein-dependent transport systems inner membrane component [Thermoproteus uzoniensis 768-20]|uniref:Binding-protein-dependent transport systems inner membrane component n=1 Tax=Thermoproteus uzoniensis (strain 768-20) TaxID=999630 RepID=F2L3E9_THEU7|nr:binding-protein-dependent transport systems inner membrane component [Thermoproteus uzoniensis 768-20]
MAYKKTNFFNYLYILPVVILVAFLYLYPIAYTVYISFTNFNLYHFFEYQWVGLSNYITVLTGGTFWQVLANTAIWTVGSLAPMIAVGFLLALILNQKDLKGRTVFFTLLLVPWAFPAFISLIVWQGMWNWKYGIVNKVLAMFGIRPIDWFDIVPMAWVMLILTNLWLSFPYYTSVFLSALQSIPEELYSIAEIDGASRLARFRYITLPLMRRTIAFVAIGGFTFTWNNFYPIYILTGGGPGNATNILVVYAYQAAFNNSLYNFAAVYSVIDAVILIAMAVIMLKYSGVLEAIT